MLSEHEIVAFCILRKTSFALTSTSFFIVSSGFLWPTFYNINDNITLVDVIPWVFLSRLPSQKTVLCCLLVILLSTVLHPRTAHFNCPDFLSLWYANLLIHTVSLDTLSHHPVSLHYRAELFPCELMCFSNQHLTPFPSRFLIKHLNGPHEKVWVLIHFHRCLGFSEFISLFNWCGPCPLLALDRYITAVQLRGCLPALSRNISFSPLYQSIQAQWRARAGSTSASANWLDAVTRLASQRGLDEITDIPCRELNSAFSILQHCLANS